MKLNKEFLSDVLEIKLDDIFYNQNSNVAYRYDNCLSVINIHELTYQIKYYIRHINHSKYNWQCGSEDHRLGNVYCYIHEINNFFHGKDEFEAVYKAGLYLWEKLNVIK